MQRAQHIAVIVLCLTLAVCAGLLTHKVNAIDLSQLNIALKTINRPCAPGPCGTLADIDKTVVKSGDAIVTTQLQEQRIGRQVSATMVALQSIPPHVNDTLDGLTATSDTASESLQTLTGHITPVLDAADATVSGLEPAEVALNKSVTDFDALISDPNLALIMRNVGTMTTTGNHMLFTADQVETKLTKCTLHPTFWCNAKGDIIFGAQIGGYLLH
jgi:hypothetical protein